MNDDDVSCASSLISLQLMKVVTNVYPFSYQSVLEVFLHFELVFPNLQYHSHSSCLHLLYVVSSLVMDFDIFDFCLHEI